MADNYSGATTEALVITGITAALSGNLYRCRATNEYGARYSDAAELTVNSSSGCIPGVTGCDCALLVPTFFGGMPYADLAAAEAVMATDVASCIAWHRLPGAVHSLSVNTSTPNLFLITVTDDGPDGGIFISINLKAGSVVSIAWNNAPGGDMGAATLDDCAYSSYGAGFLITGTSGMGSFSPAIPSDGEYFIAIPAAGGVATEFTVTCTDDMTANPLRIVYDPGAQQLPCTP